MPEASLPQDVVDPQATALRSGLPSPVAAMPGLFPMPGFSQVGLAPQPGVPAAQSGPLGQPAYPPQLEMAILRREGSRPDSVSPAGAIGEGQIMPATAAQYGVSRDQLFDPVVNERVRKQIIGDLWAKYKDPTAVMVAYNAGPGVADRWLATGKDSSVLPVETQKYIGVAATAGSTEAFSQYRGEARAGYDRLARNMDKLMDAALKEPPGSAERHAKMQEAIDASHQLQQQFRDLQRQQPHEKPVDMMQNFGSIATLIGIIGGMFSRRPLTASLGAAASAMEAINTKNHEQYQQSYKEWEKQTDLLSKSLDMQNQEFREIMEDERLTVSERQEKLANVFRLYGMDQALEQMRLGNLKDAYQMPIDLRKAQLDLDRLSAQIKQLNSKADGEREVEKTVSSADYRWLAEHPEANGVVPQEVHYQNYLAARRQLTEATTPGGLKAMNDPKVYAFRQFLTEHPDAGAEEIAKFMASQGAARSGIGSIVAQYRTEHPKATADELAQFYAHMMAASSIERGFAGGAQGNALRSISVVIDHIATGEDLVKALNNHDSRALNALTNRLKAQFGDTAVTNFDFAKKVIADEMIKAILGSGAGTGAERESLQTDLANAATPDQLFGVFQVGRRLLAGQLRGLRQQYEGGGGSLDFDQKLTPEARQALSGLSERTGDEAPKMAVPSDLPSPSGHPEGSTAKDETGKVVAVIRDGKWAAP